MRRRLFTFFAALSLLLCVAVCGLWVRSYWHSDAVVAYGATKTHGVLSRRGVVYLVREPAAVWVGVVPVTWERVSRPASAGAPMPPEASRFLGFGYAGVQGSQIAGAPWWSVFLLTVCPSLLLLRATRRAFRDRAAGLCPACGYDLRATPERCPECGSVPPLR